MNKSLILSLTFITVQLSVLCQDTVFNQFDRNHRKTGYWQSHYDNGRLRYKGYFEDDKPVGKMIKYYPGGLIQAIMIFEKKEDVSRVKLFSENGKIIAEGKYAGKLKDSVWNYYSSFDGKLTLRETFLNGRRNGPSSRFYSNGTPSEIKEWENDTEQGKWEQYYESGHLRLKCSYHQGNRNGSFQSFYPGGKLSISGEYKNGLMNGIWTYYQENGDKDYEAEYINGKMLPNEAYDKKTEEFSRKILEIVRDFPEPDHPDNP